MEDGGSLFLVISLEGLNLLVDMRYLIGTNLWIRLLILEFCQTILLQTLCWRLLGDQFDIIGHHDILGFVVCSLHWHLLTDSGLDDFLGAADHDILSGRNSLLGEGLVVHDLAGVRDVNDV